MSTRKDFIFLAKIYEQTEKFDKMVECINKFVELDPKLNLEERNLLSLGYKNVINKKRVSWRELATEERKEEKNGNKQNVEYIKELRAKIENEMRKDCELVQNTLTKHLIKSTTDVETLVFYYKLKADYHRFRAEFSLDDEYVKNYKESLEAYKEGSILAEKLSISNSIKIGLLLNHSVLHYEVILNKDRALEIAQDAYDESMKIIDELDKTKSKDTLLIIQLLKDNITLWKNDSEEDDTGI